MHRLDLFSISVYTSCAVDEPKKTKATTERRSYEKEEKGLC